MAITSSLGIGAGVDLQSLLTKLVAAEKAPITALDTKIAASNSKISLFGDLKSKLSSLQTVANTLALPTKLLALSASSSTPTVATATTEFNATTGAYAVNVTKLASAQKDFSNPYASGTTFGPGTLDFTVNGTAQSINLTGQSSYTLQDVRSAINSANIGVAATVISGSGGDRLVLTGSSTGTAGSFTLNVTAQTPTSPAISLGGLASFDTTTAGLARSSAQDGKITIDGVEVTSSTNTFSSAVNGVSFTALQIGSTNITVQSDAAKITDTLKSFVDAFNAVNSLIKVNSAYNSATKKASPFTGDSTPRSIQAELTRSRTNTPSELASATFKTLSEIGISVQQDGSLTLDSTKLNKALNSSSSGVLQTLNAYGNAFDNSISNILASDGLLTNRVNALNSSVKSYKDSQSALELRVAAIEQRYRTQFSALDRLVSSMQTTSSYLTQQLSKLQS